MGEIEKKMKFVFLFFVFLLSIFSVFALYTGKIMTGDVGAEIDPGIKVIYDIYRGQGDTTDFLYMTDEELASVGSLTLEREGYGKLILSGVTNLTQDVFEDYVNLSNHVFIYDKYVEVNSNALTSFRKSALISFYNVYFNYPYVLKDGEPCGDNCTEISYVNHVYTFGVNSFSSYELIENPNPPTQDDEDDDETPSSGGGGGGGGESEAESPTLPVNPEDEELLEESLVFSDEVISLNVKKGVYFRKRVEVENIGSKSVSVGIVVNNLTSFVFPSERFFDIAPGEKKELNLDFYFSRSQPVGVYSGDITFVSGVSTKSLVTVINVNAEDSLFDVFVNVSDSEYSPLNDVNAEILIYNVGTNTVSANVFYAIKDTSNNTLISGYESVIVKDSLNFNRSLKLPIKAVSGDYLFYVLVSYDGGYAVGSDYFYVSSNWFYEFFGSKKEIGITLAFFLVFTLIMLVWMIIKYQKSKKSSVDFVR